MYHQQLITELIACFPLIQICRAVVLERKRTIEHQTFIYNLGTNLNERGKRIVFSAICFDPKCN